VDEIRQIIQAGRGILTGIYEAAQITNAVLVRDGNLLLFGEVTLSGNNVESLAPIVGNIIAETAIYTGNRVYRRFLPDSTSPVGGGRMLTAARELERAANMPANSW
jgi:hypothetical protein